MYTIESTDYGFKLAVRGKVDRDIAEQIRFELLRALAMHNRPFCLFVDLREMIPIGPETIGTVVEIHDSCHELSLIRAALVVSSPVVRGQMEQISFDGDSIHRDRFFDALNDPDWESKAINWVTGVAPTLTGPIPRVR
jgi:hypothetical protein